MTSLRRGLGGVWQGATRFAAWLFLPEKLPAAPPSAELKPAKPGVPSWLAAYERLEGEPVVPRTARAGFLRFLLRTERLPEDPPRVERREARGFLHQLLSVERLPEDPPRVERGNRSGFLGWLLSRERL